MTDISKYKNVSLSKETYNKIDAIRRVIVPQMTISRSQTITLLVNEKEKSLNGHFSIITISSVSATVVSTNRGEYCMSKAGLAMLTKLWASRLGEYNIPVYEVRPGVIRTDMTAGVVEKYDRLFEQGLALEQRWGTPEDLGTAVAALATGKIPYATGQVLNIDGGMTIQNL